MSSRVSRTLTAVLVLLVALVATQALGAHHEGGEATKAKKGNPVVVLQTEMGDITVELYEDKAPISVANFLQYVDDGFYDGTIFHRVVADFVIQGGGMTKSGKQKTTREQIKNEAKNGLKNDKGTLSMARTSVVDSATSQFFINLKDNDFLNHGSRDYGYAVFGRVTDGMDVVEKIEKDGGASKVEITKAERKK